uniref:C2H2-type domain-containing protein n=1 Tax=viral metagenome TaxID=1070528 RepID=A0A6C0CU84_9ZZZZ
MFNCQYCRKEYTRKSAHKRHVILCEIIHSKQVNSKASLKREEKCEEEETTSIPTLTTLYHIVQELAIENKKMREEISELHKHLTKGMKKVNVLEWLNTDPEQQIPMKTFKDFMKTIQVTQNAVHILMNDTALQTIIHIVQENVQQHIMEIPIKAFSQKNNSMYIYNTQPSAITSWKKLQPEEFILMLKHIHSKILSQLCEWYNKNKTEILKGEKLSDIYDKTLHKLMSVDFETSPTLVSKIRTHLYNLIKTDLKSVEYNFEF